MVGVQRVVGIVVVVVKERKRSGSQGRTVEVLVVVGELMSLMAYSDNSSENIRVSNLSCSSSFGYSEERIINDSDLDIEKQKTLDHISSSQQAAAPNQLSQQ